MSQDRSSKSAIWLVLLTLVIIAITWRGCWFGAPLSDATVTEYLDGGTPTEMRRALAQISERISKKKDITSFHGGIEKAAAHDDLHVRAAAAWVMGDASHDPFVPNLIAMLADPALYVRENAATALTRYGNDAGRDVLLGMLEPFPIEAEATGTLRLVLGKNQPVQFGQILARIEKADGSTLDVISPTHGLVRLIEGRRDKPVGEGAVILRVDPPEDRLKNALVGLLIVGKARDREAVERLLASPIRMTPSARTQADATLAQLGVRAP